MEMIDKTIAHLTNNGWEVHPDNVVMLTKFVITDERQGEGYIETAIVYPDGRYFNLDVEPIVEYPPSESTEQTTDLPF